LYGLHQSCPIIHPIDKEDHSVVPRAMFHYLSTVLEYSENNNMGFYLNQAVAPFLEAGQKLHTLSLLFPGLKQYFPGKR
jgi:hypothetical protein